MTQLEKRLLKDGFSPQQIETIMADIVGTKVNTYKLAKRVYAEWKMDFRLETQKPKELAALKRMLKLYSEEEIVALAHKVKVTDIIGLAAAAIRSTPVTQYDPVFELEEGWKYNRPSDALEKEATYAIWRRNKEEKC